MIETPVFGHCAVAAPHHLAGEAGRRVLISGGNAIEAMVAMAASIAVVYPHMNAIGGDGFWLVSDRRQRVHYIEACGPAGALATIKSYRDAGHDVIPPRGALSSITVPGAVGGWLVALDMAKAFGGRMPLADLLSDAIVQAREGIPVSASQGRVHPREFASLSESPGFAAAFLKDGKPLPAGAPMVQTALAETLSQLSHSGLDDFYRGDVAREIAADLERIGSPVTRSDLKAYTARVREPLSMSIDGATLYSTPPPTQGLSTLVILGLFERLGIRRAETFEHIHGLIEAIKLATLVRNQVVTDPAHLTHDPSAFLTPAFLNRTAARISMDRAAKSPSISADGDTIWMGAVDKDGLAVSYIQSVFWDFGSGVVLPKTGILMQNRGMSFSLDTRARNPLQPGRLPFHTLNPAMAHFRDGRVMPFGTMGGEAQPQILGQTFSRVRLGMGLAEAIDAPRFVLGKPWGSNETILRAESRFDDAVIGALRRAGHPVDLADEAYDDAFGHSGALIRHPRDGRIEASHDPRADGGAYGF